MPKTRRVVKILDKPAPKEYFKLSTTIMLLTGMYPLSSKRSRTIRFLYAIYFWLIFFFAVVLTPVTRAIALPYLTNMDDLTENISFVINHIMGVFKILLFVSKKKDLISLVEKIQSKKFRHKDCSRTFSPNRLIRRAVRISKGISCFFSLFIVSLVLTSILRVIVKHSRIQENFELNATEFLESKQRFNRSLPFHGWFPFSTQISPNYEIVFFYQMLALVTSAYMVMAMDVMLLSLMAHIKAQFEILANNLRFVKCHVRNVNCEHFSQSQITSVSPTMSQWDEINLTEIMESELERHVAHHQAIIQLAKDLESVFTYQILLQFICSLLSLCMLLWQVSSTPILSTKFVSMFIYFVAVSVQLFLYCWFGNEVMLQSLSVADAAWDSGWNEIPSKRYCYGVVMIIQRSQKAIMITAGGFADLNLETFMFILQAAYSYFAVLKKVNS